MRLFTCSREPGRPCSSLISPSCVCAVGTLRALFSAGVRQRDAWGTAWHVGARWGSPGAAFHCSALKRVSSTATQQNLMVSSVKTSSDIQSRCSAAHLRFISEEAVIQVHQESCSSAQQKATTIWPFLRWNYFLTLDLTFETCSGAAVLFGNLCAGPHSSKICLQGRHSHPGHQAETLHSLHTASCSFPGVLRHPCSSHLPLCPLAQTVNQCPKMINQCPNSFPNFPPGALATTLQHTVAGQLAGFQAALLGGALLHV